MNHSVKTASISLFFISTLFSENIEKDLPNDTFKTVPMYPDLNMVAKVGGSNQSSFSVPTQNDMQWSIDGKES